MDCELCEKKLVDLLYDELDESAAAETRAHLESCEPCRLAMGKLELGRAFARRLELAPAPSLSGVLAAAREQAAANRALRDRVEGDAATPPAVAPREQEPSGGAVGRFLRWLGAVAMGPQLGVATVLLLVVGIGLWYLPQLGGDGRDHTLAVLEPEPQSVGETTALAPAEPLQLAHDPRTGRVVSLGEATGSSEARPTPAPETPRRREDRAGTERAPAVVEEEALAAVEQRVAASDESSAGAVNDDALPEITSAAGAFEGGTLPPVVARPSPAPGPGRAPTTGPAAVASSGARSVPAEVGMPEAPGAGPERDELAAAALHGQARSLAGAGRCADAVGRYEQLLSRYPSYPDGGRASVEMADCLRRLGRLDAARTTLERASRSSVSSVATSARRQLVELEAHERASERTEPAATP